MSGINWLTECSWTDDNGALHIDVPRLLDQLGVPDTPENRDAACKMAADVLTKLLKDNKAVIHITE